MKDWPQQSVWIIEKLDNNKINILKSKRETESHDSDNWGQYEKKKEIDLTYQMDRNLVLSVWSHCFK